MMSFRFTVLAVIIQIMISANIIASPIKFNREFLTDKYTDLSISRKQALDNKTPKCVLISENSGITIDDTLWYSGYNLGTQKKSVFAALVWSIVPGFFIHGLGHAYVDKPETFGILLGIEIMSSFIFFHEFAKGMGDNSDEEPNNAIGLTALFAWTSSWIYDIYGSATTAHKINKKYKRTNWYLVPEIDSYSNFQLKLKINL